MSETTNRRGKVTPENLQESAALRAIWDRTYESRKALGLHSQGAFGERYEIGNQAAVGFFLGGKTALSLKAARGFAEGLGCAISEFSPRLAAELSQFQSVNSSRSDEQSQAWVAHSMSYPGQIMLGEQLEWEALMSSKLPKTFTLELRDDALGDLAPKGSIGIFETGREPAPNKGVLFADREGVPHLRIYEVHSGKRWRAVAKSAGFAALDSETDGLTVLAVMVGVKWM